MLNIELIADEISNQGFSVIKNVIADQLNSDLLCEHIRHAEKFSDGVIGDIPEELMVEIRRSLGRLIPEIAKKTNIDISEKLFSYCAIRIEKSDSKPILRKPFNFHQDPKIAPGGVLNWHLDHYSYYLYRDHSNWLICYIPIFKPNKSLANLAIIPRHVVKELNAHLYKEISGRGAMRFRCAEHDTLEWFCTRFPESNIQAGDWFAIDDDADESSGFKIKFDLEQYKVIPELEVYDLLIMRADTIHRTSDAGSDRISVRCDAMPKNAMDVNSWPGLISLSIKYPFMGAKRKYNIKKWLQKAWRLRLEKCGL